MYPLCRKVRGGDNQQERLFINVILRILRDFTLDLTQVLLRLRKIKSDLHGDMQIVMETLQHIRKYVVTRRAKFLVGWSIYNLPESQETVSTEEYSVMFLVSLAAFLRGDALSESKMGGHSDYEISFHERGHFACEREFQNEIFAETETTV